MNARSLCTLATMSLVLCLCGLALGGYFKGRCPNDEAVIEWFNANKKTLNELLSMVAADDERITYVGQGMVEVRPGTSLSDARKQEYLRKVRDTGADHFTYQRGEGATVGLWTDATSITASSRYKDVEYIQDINKWRYRDRLRASLDGLEKSNGDTIWLRHIEGKWYIVYMKG